VPDSGVIASVSETLLTVLKNAVSGLDNPAPTAELSDLIGPIATTPARLTIFLFEISEDPSARNKPRVRGVAAPDVTLTKPAMALVLRYLLTAWGGDRLTSTGFSDGSCRSSTTAPSSAAPICRAAA
jgi:hypothetical protein